MPFARDTSPEARRILLDVLRRKTPAERARMIADAIESAQALARAGVRAHCAEDSPALRHAAYLRRWLGPQLSEVVFAEWLRRNHGGDTNLG